MKSVEVGNISAVTENIGNVSLEGRRTEKHNITFLPFMVLRQHINT